MNKNFIKVLLCLMILFSILSCDRIYKTVDEKINKAVDNKIDETIKKIDSLVIKKNIDSLTSKIDSSINRTKKKFK